MSFTVVKYSGVWRQLTIPNVFSFFIILIALQASVWALIFEKFKPAMDSLTALFYDNSFGWFYIRQTGVVLAAQFFGTTTVLMIAQVILMHTKRLKNGG